MMIKMVTSILKIRKKGRGENVLKTLEKIEKRRTDSTKAA